jgi:BMFP domain-containing protein YqiC
MIINLCMLEYLLRFFENIENVKSSKFALKNEDSPMQTTNRVFDDIAKLFIGLIGLGKGLKTDLTQHILKRAERYATQMDLVTRQEFEVFAEVAQNAKLQSEALEERISRLEEDCKKVDNDSKV